MDKRKERISLLIAQDYYRHANNQILEEFNIEYINHFFEMIIDQRLSFAKIEINSRKLLPISIELVIIIY